MYVCMYVCIVYNMITYTCTMCMHNITLHTSLYLMPVMSTYACTLSIALHCITLYRDIYIHIIHMRARGIIYTKKDISDS